MQILLQPSMHAESYDHSSNREPEKSSYSSFENFFDHLSLDSYFCSIFSAWIVIYPAYR